jgi:hypothetical protein
MFDMTILGQIAPALLILGAIPLMYRVYLRARHRLKGLTSFTMAVVQLLIGTVCVLACFFSTPYYGSLTAGMLMLVGASDALVIAPLGRKFSFAALIALGVGIWFGYLGSATVKYKVGLFFELIGKNVPESNVGIALGALIALAVFLVLNFLQELLATFGTILDFPVLSLATSILCLAQGCLLLLGTSLQPILTEIIAGL